MISEYRLWKNTKAISFNFTSNNIFYEIFIFLAVLSLSPNRPPLLAGSAGWLGSPILITGGN